MFRKDRIFWCAASISVLAIILFIVTEEQLWLALMIAAYLLRPTLASLGIRRRSLDERQMSIQYRSGNIAFAAMMAAAIIMAVALSAQDNHDWEMFVIVILVGLVTKALFNVLLTKNYRRAATTIIITVGAMITLFASMSHGLSLTTLMEAAPGLAVVGIGLLSKKFPRIVGTLVFIATAALEFVILQKGFTIGQLATATLVGVPLVLAGACLFVRDPDSVVPEDNFRAPTATEA